MATFKDLYELRFDESKIEEKETGRNIEVAPGKWEKEKLSYLSWAWAWGEFCSIYPDADWSPMKYIHPDGIERDYCYDENLGYKVGVTVTDGSKYRSMELYVMDSHNLTMFNHPYSVKFGKGEVTVPQATYKDINTSIMRCLVKCLAAKFGFGLYIYAGEDIPRNTETQNAASNGTKPTTKATAPTDASSPTTAKENEEYDATRLTRPTLDEVVKFAKENNLGQTLKTYMGDTLVKDYTEEDKGRAISWAVMEYMVPNKWYVLPQVKTNL